MQIPAFSYDKDAGLELILAGIPYTLMQLTAEPLRDFFQELTISGPFGKGKGDPFLPGLFSNRSEKFYGNLHIDDFRNRINQMKFKAAIEDIEIGL